MVVQPFISLLSALANVNYDVEVAARTTWTTGASPAAGRTSWNRSPPTPGPTFPTFSQDSNDTFFRDEEEREEDQITEGNFLIPVLNPQVS